MTLTFLGTSDGHTRRGRQHSGLLVSDEGGTMLVDAGADVPQFLLAHRLPTEVPTSLYLSHLHSDHTAHLGALFQHLWLQKRSAPLTVYAPAGVRRILEPWLVHSLLFPGLLPFPVNWHDLQAGAATDTSLGTLTPIATTHLARLRERFAETHPTACFDCYGLALKSERRRLIVSSDLGAAHDLAPMLDKPTDVLIVEMAHFSAEDLVEELKEHEVRQVWLTHYADELPARLGEIQKLAVKAGFAGEIAVATDGLEVAV
ncbi:MAG: MBL fold metallo-hydrolase [Verrucomicrobiota bacterium]